MTECMVEQTVIFDNPSIENHVLLTGPYEYGVSGTGDELMAATSELRSEAEKTLGALKDEQVFYRFLRR